VAPLLLLLLAAPDAGAVLQEARRLFDQLEYDRVLPVARQVLARPDATLQQKLDAYLLEGSCLAIIGDPVEAEQPFRLLLRARPGFDLPQDTPPKILAVFRKVQSEEQVIHEQMRAFERQQIIESISFDGSIPTWSRGGTPLPIEMTIRDPRGAVKEVNLHYRRAGEDRYSILAMKVCSGGWCAEIPSSWTENDHDFLLQCWISVSDVEGRELLTNGSADAPLTVQMNAGRLQSNTPVYEAWWFWTIIGVVVVGAGTTAAVLATRGPNLPETDLGEVPYR